MIIGVGTQSLHYDSLVKRLGLWKRVQTDRTRQSHLDTYINPKYAIVDTTPTVVSLFGGTPLSGSDGVPLTTLGGSDVDPVDLKQALEDAIATNDFPPFVTGVSLGLRTIFATIPYYVYMFGNDLGAGLPSVILVPVKILFDGLYVATNVPAQIVALLTGVTGARIFPIISGRRNVTHAQCTPPDIPGRG